MNEREGERERESDKKRLKRNETALPPRTLVYLLGGPSIFIHGLKR